MPNRASRETSRHRGPARSLARLLRLRREERSLSQQQLAQRAGVAIGTVRAIESMRTVEPGFFTVVALASELDLDIATLLAAVEAGSTAS